MRISLNPTNSWWPVWLFGCLMISPVFAKEPEKKGASKKSVSFDVAGEDEDDPKDHYQTRVETPLIGEYTTFAGLTAIKVEGVGLVVGLNGTGGNPAPSPFRTALLEDLKHRNVRNPNDLLKRPDTALVYIRAFLPPLLDKGENIDVQVWIPESANATSLEGGWLMESYLTEQAFVPGKGQLAGHHYARAKGPVLTAAIGKNKKDSPALLKRGIVLGGGTVTRERELSIYLRNDFRSMRNAIRIAEAISRRFHDFDKHGTQQPMAEAKNDQKIKLLVHPKYKNNFHRYLQVVRHLAFREEKFEQKHGNRDVPLAKRLRIDRLREELQVPEKAEQAALQLEGIGADAIPALKAGLSAGLLECRFHAAVALAYLGEAEGVEVLAEATRSEPAFRVFALAALSVIDNADAHVALRKLMNESSMETKYGAFRSLWVLDKNDPFIQGELIKVMEGKTGYMLHEVDTENEPLVHLATRTRPEVVLFGANQKMSAPMYLTAGKNIMITAQAGAQTASIRRFSTDAPDEHREVPLNVSDVIRAVSELDATYPDVVQMLMQADAQHNLPGRFTHDSLPEAGRMYERPAMPGAPASKGGRKTRIGRDNMAPNIFHHETPQEEKLYEEDKPEESSGAMTNVPPERDPKAADKSTAEDKSPKADEKPSKPTAAAKKPERSFRRILPAWATPGAFRGTKGNTEPELPAEPKSESKPESIDTSEPPPQSEPE